MTTTKGSFHPDFDDSQADLVIECKGGIKLRAHSYLLVAHSEYFRAMPSPSSSPAGKGDRSVHMDCASDYPALILKLIDKIDCGKLVWYELVEILKIGQRYQFKHIADMVRDQASKCITYDSAIPIFQFAGMNDFPDLAKLAIAGFNETDVYCKDHNSISLSVCDNVPGKYGAALIRAMAKHQSDRDLETKVRWARISGDFDVLN